MALIEPCPFCGSMNVKLSGLVDTDDGTGPPTAFVVQCEDCSSSGPIYRPRGESRLPHFRERGRDGAWREWNRRQGVLFGR